MKIPKWLLPAFLLLLFSPIFLIWTILFRIKYRPLPPIAREAVRYRIADVGTSPEDWRAFYSWNDGEFTYQLGSDGRVIFDAPGGKQRVAKWKIERAARAKQLGLSDNWVRAIKNQRTLAWGEEFELWQGKSKVASCKNRIAAYPKWPIYDFRLEFFGAGSEIIGNGRIATAGASSGGASSPHGRLLPVIWDVKSNFVRDLNALIDPKSGLYLHRALAVNSRGQILCLGQKTDALGAETPDWKQPRRLILTPIAAPHTK